MTKIRVIELSLRCYVFGLIGLIPIIGLPLSILALATFRKVLEADPKIWNPARRYWISGAVLGGMSCLVSLLLFGLLLVAITD